MHSRSTSMRVALESGGKRSERAQAQLAAGAVLGFLWLARELLVPVALAIVVASSVWPIVNGLERLRVPHGVAAP